MLVSFFFLFGVEIASAERRVLLLRGPPSCSARGSCPRGPAVAAARAEHEENTRRTRAALSCARAIWVQHRQSVLKILKRFLKVSQKVCVVPPHRHTSNTGSHSTSKSNSSPSSICVSMSIPIWTGKRCSRQSTESSNSAKVAFAQPTWEMEKYIYTYYNYVYIYKYIHIIIM